MCKNCVFIHNHPTLALLCSYYCVCNLLLHFLLLMAIPCHDNQLVVKLTLPPPNLLSLHQHNKKYKDYTSPYHQYPATSSFHSKRISNQTQRPEETTTIINKPQSPHPYVDLPLERQTHYLNESTTHDHSIHAQ